MNYIVYSLEKYRKRRKIILSMNVYYSNHLIRQDKVRFILHLSYLCRIQDPGWQEKAGSGINIPDPQHWIFPIKRKIKAIPYTRYRYCWNLMKVWNAGTKKQASECIVCDARWKACLKSFVCLEQWLSFLRFFLYVKSLLASLLWWLFGQNFETKRKWSRNWWFCRFLRLFLWKLPVGVTLQWCKTCKTP
jgi:hypothetical protein